MSLARTNVHHFTPEFLAALIKAGESSLVEFKRQWYDLSQKRDVAEMAKDVLALSNTVAEGDVGLIVIGVGDPSRGGGVTGVASPPSPEAVAQVLVEYTKPPVKALVRHHTVGGVTISAIEVTHAPFRPHTSTREFAGVLKRDVVYCRRDATIGILTLDEIEAMIRLKDARLGPVVAREPILAGFLDAGDWSTRTAVIRVENVTAEPIGGVGVMIDASLTHNAQAFVRRRFMQNGTLEPGESREMTFDFRTTPVLLDGKPVDHQRLGNRWVELTLRVHYVDPRGHVRQLETKLSIGD